MQLKNGVTVLLKENRQLPIVSVHTWVKVGSVNEDETTLGLSHFLEHLIFKGSKNYPGDAITRKVETQGGMINAGTSKEFTNYYIDIRKEACEDAVRILADAMANALLPAEEIEKERPVVLEEIARHNDNPNAMVDELFDNSLFLKTPYRTPILGSEAVIKNVTRDNIMKYYHTHYVPKNIYVAIVGDFNTADIEKLVKETFGKQEVAPLPEQPALNEPEHKPVFLAKTKDVEHAYWLGGFLGPDIHSNEQFSADIAANILGGGRSSRLFRILREQKRIVYNINSGYISQRGTGVFAFSAIFDPKNEQEVINAVMLEITLLKEGGPTDDELKRAKESLRSQWYFGTETFNAQASNLGYWHMQGRPEMIDGYVNKIMKITKKDVTDFLKKHYKPYGLNQAVIVPKTANAK